MSPNNPLISKSDLQLLNQYNVKIEVDSKNNCGLIVINNRTLKVSLFNGSVNNKMELDKKQQFETAQKIAVMLLKKGLKEDSNFQIDSKGIENNSISNPIFYLHESDEEGRNTRPDYVAIQNYFNAPDSNIKIPVKTKELERLQNRIKHFSKRQYHEPRGLRDLEKNNFSNSQKPKLIVYENIPQPQQATRIRYPSSNVSQQPTKLEQNDNNGNKTEEKSSDKNSLAIIPYQKPLVNLDSDAKQRALTSFFTETKSLGNHSSAIDLLPDQKITMPKNFINPPTTELLSSETNHKNTKSSAIIPYNHPPAEKVYKLMLDRFFKLFAFLAVNSHSQVKDEQRDKRAKEVQEKTNDQRNQTQRISENNSKENSSNNETSMLLHGNLNYRYETYVKLNIFKNASDFYKKVENSGAIVPYQPHPMIEEVRNQILNPSSEQTTPIVENNSHLQDRQNSNATKTNSFNFRQEKVLKSIRGIRLPTNGSNEKEKAIEPVIEKKEAKDPIIEELVPQVVIPENKDSDNNKTPSIGQRIVNFLYQNGKSNIFQSRTNQLPTASFPTPKTKQNKNKPVNRDGNGTSQQKSHTPSIRPLSPTTIGINTFSANQPSVATASKSPKQNTTMQNTTQREPNPFSAIHTS